VTALDGVDLVVDPGQAVGIAGPNGAGKSTLLRILLGLVRPTSGSAELFGVPVRPGTAALARVGALVDGPGFVPYLTGRRNLQLALQSSGKVVTADELEEALDQSGLGAALDRPYRTYSHGMRYRLGLTQALIGSPDLLLLDEPTTGLDPVHAAEVIASIRSALASGVSLILSSHELPLIEALCTDVTVLYEGRVALEGPVSGLVRTAGSLLGAYLQAVGPQGHHDIAAAAQQARR
jgi:ABC-2 type transport system ATP-binding protein